MNRKIKALLVMPGKEAQLVKIPANIKFIKSFIGENLQKVRLNNDVILIANRDSKFEDANRFLGDNLILGTFLIVNFKNNHRVNLNNRQIRKYTNTFLLRKHTRKIELLKKEYFKNYYSSINQNLIAA